jgi:hypothetical protein
VEELCQIPKRVLKTLWIDEYFAAFWVQVQSGMTHVEAYLYIENQLQLYGLPPRYSSYESFKRGKSNFLGQNEPILRFF